MNAKITYVYIDGFNLYHALDDLNQDHLKWLDLWGLSEKLLPNDGSEVLSTVKYFSAYATWREESMRLHQRYVAALKTKDVTIILGRFKEKRNRCLACGTRYISHEEKETDVNIGAHLMVDAIKGRFDRALIISADTDLNGVVELARKESGRLIQIIAPPKRKNRNRSSLFEISLGKIKQSLLPEICIDKNGSEIVRPKKYTPNFSR